MPALPQPLPQMACLHQTTDRRSDSGGSRCSEIAENANAAGQTEGAAVNPVAPASGAHAQGEEVPANDSFFGTFTSCTADAVPGFSYAANAFCNNGALTTTASATAGFDPQVAAATAGTAQANLVAVPMMLFSSNQDVTVVKAFNAALLAKTLNSAGGGNRDQQDRIA
ncbi:MAG: hypothetical protein ACRYFU_24790 [Janthinobacterium lividum]